MAREVGAWRQLVVPHFSYLGDHGFLLTGADASTAWETWVEYTSEIGGVRIIDNVEFDRVEVELISLVDGMDPSPQDAARRALLDNVAEVRSPGLVEPDKSLGGRSPDDTDRQLRFWAELLPRVATDFLAGSDSLFVEVAELIAERVRKNPWPPASD